MTMFMLFSFLASLAIDNALGLNSTRTRPNQQILSVQTIPDGIDIYVDSTWLSDDTTSGTNILIDGDLYFTLPVGFDTDPLPEFADYASDIMHQSLPGLLRQFGIDETEIQPLVDEYSSLAADAIVDAIVGSGGDVLKVGNIFADVIDWTKRVISRAVNIVISAEPNVVCGVFAVATTPGYEGINLLLQALNAGTDNAPTTNNQDFFIFPLHGPISHDDDIVVYYDATFPPGFGNADGVTMGKTIYLIYPTASSQYGDSRFAQSTRTLLHEFTHTKQYKEFGYFTPAFGAKYLFNHCKGGGYWTNPMENAGRANENAMDRLLDDPVGRVNFSPSITQELCSQPMVYLSHGTIALSVRYSMN
ncbi:hypothetical protein LTR56_016471 [Elasticomyces elasticus]|nr:hypothetical protein LTR56_016471 [Elasticomyces elasticus]KAK3633477.1 hypothetical protein LTR22_020097 [Elasticomyces elasticus]